MYDINSAVSLWDRLAVTRKPIIMYGMGDGAQKILDVASEKGIKISGFMASDDFVRGHSFAGFEVKKLKFKSLYADTVIDGHRCIILKPQTYMNNSGEAIGECAKFYKIPPERVIVIFDDISLDVGKLRIRRKGSDGGHNGIKSIIQHLGSSDFPRIKIGVGKKPHPEFDLKDWVLGEFSKNDRKALVPALENAASAVSLIMNGETDKAMNLYNS